MRYIHKKDERLTRRDDLCRCGHAPEVHQDDMGACQALDPTSGEPCACVGYEPEDQGFLFGRESVGA
jgi:hypothetical protein